jgi:hypothetical protein
LTHHPLGLFYESAFLPSENVVGIKQPAAADHFEGSIMYDPLWNMREPLVAGFPSCWPILNPPVRGLPATFGKAD